MYTFETPLPKLQYLDMSAVFMKVDSKSYYIDKYLLY